MSFDVKITTFPHVLDLILPYHCRGCGKVGEPLCGCCKKYIMGQGFEIEEETGTLEKVWASGQREGVLRKLIVEYKYQSRRGFTRTLAEILAGAIPEEERKRLAREKAVIVPLPTISRHIRERGFDHTKKLAKELGRILDLCTMPVLVRANKTVQVGAGSEVRAKQAEEAYRVNPKFSDMHQRPILLLDDIWTTGASMRAAGEKMRQAGFRSVSGAVIATGLKSGLVATHAGDGADDEADDGVGEHTDN